VENVFLLTLHKAFIILTYVCGAPRRQQQTHNFLNYRTCKIRFSAETDKFSRHMPVRELHMTFSYPYV